MFSRFRAYTGYALPHLGLFLTTERKSKKLSNTLLLAT